MRNYYARLNYLYVGDGSDYAGNARDWGGWFFIHSMQVDGGARKIVSFLDSKKVDFKSELKYVKTFKSVDLYLPKDTPKMRNLFSHRDKPRGRQGNKYSLSEISTYRAKFEASIVIAERADNKSGKSVSLIEKNATCVHSDVISDITETFLIKLNFPNALLWDISSKEDF